MTTTIPPYIYGPVVDDWLADETGITLDDPTQTLNADGYLVLCDGLGPRQHIPGKAGRDPLPMSKDILVYVGLIQRGGAVRGYVRRPRRRV